MEPFHIDIHHHLAPEQYVTALQVLAPLSHILYGSDYPWAPETEILSSERWIETAPSLDEQRRQETTTRGWRKIKERVCSSVSTLRCKAGPLDHIGLALGDMLGVSGVCSLTIRGDYRLISLIGS